MLILNQVCKKYNTYCVIENASFEIGKGITALLAPNGYGKTTLLKMLATVEKPTLGKIQYFGKDIYQLKDNYRTIIGYLPQKVGYYGDWTAAENLEYIGTLKGVTNKAVQQRMDYWLEVFHLTESKNKKTKTFSGGMIQRLGIIGALINDPDILLLDEPSAGLDPNERQNLKSVLAELSLKKSILISTHITADVEYLANYVVMLDKGEIMYSGGVEKLPQLVQGSAYETIINVSDYKEFIHSFLILDERSMGSKIKLKFYSKRIPNFSVQKCELSLNDIFLIVYGEQVV